MKKIFYSKKKLFKTILVFAQSNDSVAVKVVIKTFIPFFLLLYFSFILYDKSLLLAMLCAVPIHFFHSRIFVIMHDCGHFSFFKNRLLNTLLGHICGIFFMTPFLMWRELHNKHHKNQGCLELRGASLDVWTMTKNEFKHQSQFKKIIYKIYRNPIVLFLIAPFVLFGLIFRFPFERFSFKAVVNIFVLNILIFLFYKYLITWLGLTKWFYLQVPWMSLSFILAAWLFYIQHQFTDTIWQKKENFKTDEIALLGSSFYLLPKWLNWATADIGYHHIHHFNVRIPLYSLEKAHNCLTNTFKDIKISQITLTESFWCFRLKLWDEDLKKLVPFN